MKILAVICLLMLCGCGGGSGGSGGASAKATNVTGTDMTGVYKVHDIQCYNSSLTTMTNATTYSGTYSDIINIDGNNYSSTTLAGACFVQSSGAINFAASEITLSKTVVDSATNGSCTVVETLNGTNISPNSISTTFTTNESVGTSHLSYFQDATTGDIGIYTIYTDGGGGYCFEMLEKQ